jgi:hypothetical protein
MRIVAFFGYAMALTSTMLAADFPAVDKLPAQAELPDPLVCLDGTRITTKEAWIAKRSPELKELFQHYMYGYFPPKPDNLSFQVERVDPKALGGKATLKEVTISFGPPQTPKLQLLVVIPNKRTGPAPVFLGPNFTGNHTVLADPRIRISKAWMRPGKGVKDNRATEEGRGSAVDTWNIESAIDRGYAVATVYYGDIDPDRADVREGIQPHLAKPGAKPRPTDWSTITAWAWGLHRCIDYLATDADIDIARLVLVGHSRLGKTALLAGAFDERVAIAIPHQAGCGGTAPSRGKIGESVQQINDRFPHWFNGNFKLFNKTPEKLPFDQHCLVALMAPRPVLLSNAAEDQWANPSGQFDVLKAAEPVYRLFGLPGCDASKMPAPGQLVPSVLGYYYREGKHSMNKDDWKAFLDYADAHLKKK